MAARFEFDLRFDHARERVAARDAALPWLEPSRAGEAAPFEFPWLQPSRAPQTAGDPAPPARTFSEAELDAALACARAEAAAAAEASVRAALEAGMAARRTAALERIAAELSAHRRALDQAIATRASVSCDLALALARALVPRALERQPLADIEAMLRDLLVRLEGQPRLILALPPALVEAGQQVAREIGAETGYRGELVVEPDARLGAGDARLSWPGGDAERDLALLEREAIALVDAWLPETAAESPLIECQLASTNGAMS
jgi:flagellar biosynthesis/type III secretory pathway protein FliH